MAKSEMIRARMEPALKKQVEYIFKKIGLSVTDAINIFYHQVQLRKGLPFHIALPNQTTLQTFSDTDRGKNITECRDCDDMFDKLGI